MGNVAQTGWTVDPIPDANGNLTLRVADGSDFGSLEAGPVATIYCEDAARLIAAAPDLLSACQAALDFLDDGTLWDELSPAERTTQLALRFAIEKAKGGDA